MARRKHREGEELSRVLGVFPLFSTGYGNVGSSIYYALGVVAAAALGATPLVFLLTGLLFICTAWTYAEATAALPEAGGAASFVRRAFNEFASFGIGWGQMLVYTATIAISAIFVPQYLSVFWPILRDWPYNAAGGIIVTVALVFINVVGIREASRINIVLAVMDLATQLFIVTMALVLLLQPAVLIGQIDFGVAPTLRSFLYGLAIGTVAYTGIETISNMAEEARNPGRDLPRAINMVIVVVLIIYISMPLAGLSAMPVGTNVVPMDPERPFHTQAVRVVPGDPEGTFVVADAPDATVYVPVEEIDGEMVIPAQQPDEANVHRVGDELVATLYGTQLASNFDDRPVLGVVRFLPESVDWARVVLVPWVGVLAATILVAATNAGIIGVSRLTYSFGQHRQLPPVLGRLHAKRMTPYVSIILFGSAACVLILPGQVGLLVDLYVFGSMISFTAAHVSLIVLRIKEPDLERPWRTPLNVRVKGRLLPLTAIAGGMGTFGAWLVIVWFQSGSRIVGFSWIAVGLVAYVIYRRSMGYSLTKEVPRTVMPASMQADIGYRKIMVPTVGTRVSDMMMVLACQLAIEKQSTIHGIYVIEVPLTLPLDAHLTNERQRAQQSVEAAALIASQFKVPFTSRIVPARRAGPAIVDEARASNAEVIILGTMRKRRVGDEAFGRTIDHVVDHAPCEVLLNIVPSGYPTEGSGKLDVRQPQSFRILPADQSKAGPRRPTER